MPQWGNQDYKKAVFEQLSQGSGGGEDDHFQHFENFSSGAPRRNVEAGVGEAFHPEGLSSDEVEPQFRTAAQKMHPNECAEIAQDLLDSLHKRRTRPDVVAEAARAELDRPRPGDSGRRGETNRVSRQNHPEVFRRRDGG